jgi:hypothetical protein
MSSIGGGVIVNKTVDTRTYAEPWAPYPYPTSTLEFDQGTIPHYISSTTEILTPSSSARTNHPLYGEVVVIPPGGTYLILIDITIRPYVNTANGPALTTQPGDVFQGTIAMEIANTNPATFRVPGTMTPFL